MPLFEFFCAKCNERFEKLCRSTSEKEAECSKCGTSAGKVFSTFRSGKTNSGGAAASAGSSCGG